MSRYIFDIENNCDCYCVHNCSHNIKNFKFSVIAIMAAISVTQLFAMSEINCDVIATMTAI